jgi:uncharacterized protein (TIGR03000 family)
MLRTTSYCAAVVALVTAALPAWAWGWHDTTYNGGFGPGPFPPSYYGYPLDDYTASYYGGSRYREYYGYGRGFGIADMPGPVPGPLYPYGYHPPRHEPVILHDEFVPPSPEVVVPQDPNAALLNVSVPADAEVWLEGKPTNQTGSHRQFESPALKPGQEYTYTIRARWKDEGRNVEVMRLLSVHAGDKVDVRLDGAAVDPQLPMPKPLQLGAGR